MDERTASAVAWLSAADEPAVQQLTRRELLGEDSSPDPEAVVAGPWVSALLAGQEADGGFGADLGRRLELRPSGRGSPLVVPRDATPSLGVAGVRGGHGSRRRSRSGRPAIELFLRHRVFRRGGTGEPIKRPLAVNAVPPVLALRRAHALLVISRGERCTDARAADALDLVEEQRRPDGGWNARAQWWRAADSRTTPDVVDWGAAGRPNLMVTLNALRVLTAAGRVVLR